MVTITQFKGQVREHEDREDSSAQTGTKRKDGELQPAFTEKERQLQESQFSLAKKLKQAERQIASLHAGLETTRSELFEVKSKYDQVTSVKSSDMEMVKAEFDHANERAAGAERQAERLKQQLTLVTESINLRSEQHNSASGHTMDILKRSSLEIELAAKDKEVARLIEDVQRLNKLRETALTQVTRLEAELSAKNQAFRVLEEKLRTQDNYEDVKRELRVLKSAEFANAYGEDSSAHDRKTLEILLLEKTKLLHTDSSHLKLVTSCLPCNNNSSSSATYKTTHSNAKKTERSPTPMPSSTSPVPLFSPTSTIISADLVSAPVTTPSFNRCLSVSCAKTSSTEVTTSTITVPKVMSSSPTLTPAATVIKQEVSSPVSTTLHAPPHSVHAPPHSVAYVSDSYTNMAISDLTVNFLRMSSTPSSGRYSPTANCKLSPDIPTPSQTPHANSGPPQSPITALHPHMDQRHFAPPFYGFPSNPFHPAFLPLNMVKSEVNSAGGLDTGYVAKTVRELLSIHNIGQRLFAKHVLGLSQGTVSELLSKPKSWDKLTEKGRESYRKMHAWAIDDANIMALKAISPKKGTQPITSNNSYKEKEDSATEERIANILSEAQVAMHMKKSLEQQQVAGAIVSSLYHHELSKLGGTPSGLAMLSPTMPPVSLSNGPHYSREGPRKIKDSDPRYHSSSSSQEDMASAQEIVTRIYRQELIKLKKAADAAGNIAASSMYAQELSRLDNSQNTGTPVTSSSQLRQLSPSSPPPADSPEPSPLALDYRSTRPNGIKLKTEHPDSTSDETASHINSCGAIDLSKPSSRAGSTPSSSPTSESGHHAGSAFFIVHPRMNGHDSGVSENPQTLTQQQQQGSAGGPRYGSVPPAECLSPLQRMQNIANSLTTRPSVGMPSNKPLRAVLPPITQEEFDRYANVNTDDLVKKIKETLSQYSISQRLFGESILGLSQGSVSDLLARPKPWHMLTQKGREPFIRMQIFLEDAESIPKLVASQYRIPPDKLMRSNSRGSSEPAHRRRKSSMDDRSFDSPTQPKRPRVFFTEDQKDSLRQAYSQDPYPNQSTIETLAKNLNVGVKTVINWFHNHRMRAKQQHHAGGDTSVKSEPDESSNQSDISSMSGDVTSAMAGGQYFHGGITPTDVNQWIFPQFEPVGLMRKVPCLSEDNSEDNKENNGGLEEDEEDEDEDDEPDGLDSSTLASNTNKKDNEDVEENGNKTDNDDGGKHEGDDITYDNQILTKSGEDICGGMLSTAANSSSVNKRKRSNPQRVYEGAQLDRTLNVDKVTAGSCHPTDEKVELLMDSLSEQSGYCSGSIHASTNIKYISTEDMNGYAYNSGSVSSPVDCKKYSFQNANDSNTSRNKQEYDNQAEHRIQKIEKIQKAIRSTVEHWDDDNGDEKVACSSIEKIQKHLETKPADEDWEF